MIKGVRLPDFRGKAAVIMMLGAVLCVPAVVCGAQSPASYITDKDLQVAVRTFSFVYGMPKGNIEIEIVYDPDNPASASEAAQLDKIIGSGGVFANRTVTAKTVAIANMGASGSKIAYVTHGLEGKYDLLLQKATSEKMLTFSTDFQCVDTQKCVMGIEADPAIKIELSRSATNASGLEFSQALKLMIREVE